MIVTSQLPLNYFLPPLDKGTKLYIIEFRIVMELTAMTIALLIQFI